jgi:hypothetical protein
VPDPEPVQTRQRRVFSYDCIDLITGHCPIRRCKKAAHDERPFSIWWPLGDLNRYVALNNTEKIKVKGFLQITN